MKASESIHTLYDIVAKIKGPQAAKKFVCDCVFGVISDLHDENSPVTSDAIDERLAKVANDFITASKSKNDVA